MSETFQTVTGPQLIAEVRKAAEQRPDKAFSGAGTGKGSGCRYFYGNNRPCCIVGHAFSALGITAKMIREDNTMGIYSLVMGYGSPDHKMPNVGYRASKWLADVQHRQDEGEPWGEAVRQADERRDQPQDDI